MPRYYFNLISDRALAGPVEVELPTVKEARSWGLQTLDEILRDESMTFWDGSEWQMNVSDASGKCILRLRFSAEA
jgi:hypothetical protein